MQNIYKYYNYFEDCCTIHAALCKVEGCDCLCLTLSKPAINCSPVYTNSIAEFKGHTTSQPGYYTILINNVVFIV